MYHTYFMYWYLSTNCTIIGYVDNTFLGGTIETQSTIKSSGMYRSREHSETLIQTLNGITKWKKNDTLRKNQCFVGLIFDFKFVVSNSSTKKQFE